MVKMALPKELQDMLDSIVLEVEDEDGDPDWLIAMMPAIIARLGKNLIKSNWALWSKAWQSAIGTAWEMGTVGDTVGTVAPALIGGNEGLQYFLNHGMELVKTLSQTDIQLLKGQMVDNWGKGEDAFKAAFEDQYDGSARLDKIYRTEYVRAQNEGVMVRAKRAGHAFKMWRCPNDERSCPECVELDFEVVPIDEEFSAGVMGPGLHPFCRCVLISLENEEDAGIEEDVEPIIT